MSDTEVVVALLPPCDIHRGESDDSTVDAAYDGKTRWGPWANMCEDCWNHYGVGLGLGKGQRLIARGLS